MSFCKCLLERASLPWRPWRPSGKPTPPRECCQCTPAHRAKLPYSCSNRDQQFRSYDFLVDTGAQVVTLEPALASELGIRTLGVTGVGGVATYKRSPYAYVDLITAGELPRQVSMG
jgi:hypothetical protein